MRSVVELRPRTVVIGLGEFSFDNLPVLRFCKVGGNICVGKFVVGIGADVCDFERGAVFAYRRERIFELGAEAVVRIARRVVANHRVRAVRIALDRRRKVNERDREFNGSVLSVHAGEYERIVLEIELVLVAVAVYIAPAHFFEVDFRLGYVPFESRGELRRVIVCRIVNKRNVCGVLVASRIRVGCALVARNREALDARRHTAHVEDVFLAVVNVRESHFVAVGVEPFALFAVVISVNVVSVVSRIYPVQPRYVYIGFDNFEIVLSRLIESVASRSEREGNIHAVLADVCRIADRRASSARHAEIRGRSVIVTEEPSGVSSTAVTVNG